MKGRVGAKPAGPTDEPWLRSKRNHDQRRNESRAEIYLLHLIRQKKRVGKQVNQLSFRCIKVESHKYLRQRCAFQTFERFFQSSASVRAPEKGGFMMPSCPSVSYNVRPIHLHVPPVQFSASPPPQLCLAVGSPHQMNVLKIIT